MDTTSLSSGHHILTQEKSEKPRIPQYIAILRSPAGTTAENIFIWWPLAGLPAVYSLTPQLVVSFELANGEDDVLSRWPPDNMWWPPDSDVGSVILISDE